MQIKVFIENAWPPLISDPLAVNSVGDLYFSKIASDMYSTLLITFNWDREKV